ncbi:hypothetical protein [uncultured Cohaesibacter sp.]|nr:hypothetical protein [uncultured Cohaesibacter sp.]
MFSELIQSTRHLFACLPAASRIANAIEYGREPAQADLKKLDLDDIFNL